jgi:hypothetical protein
VSTVVVLCGMLHMSLVSLLRFLSSFLMSTLKTWTKLYAYAVFDIMTILSICILFDGGQGCHQCFALFMGFFLLW